MKLESPSPLSKDIAICRYPEPHQSSPRPPPILFINELPVIIFKNNKLEKL
jgi:hypothetical protein